MTVGFDIPGAQLRGEPRLHQLLFRSRPGLLPYGGTPNSPAIVLSKSPKVKPGTARERPSPATNCEVFECNEGSVEARRVFPAVSVYPLTNPAIYA